MSMQKHVQIFDRKCCRLLLSDEKYIYLMTVKTQLLQYMLTSDLMLFYHSYQIRSQYQGNIKQSR